MKTFITKAKNLNFINFQTRQQRKRLLFVMISLLLAIYLTLLYYPGVLYSDSYVRWKSAKSLLHAFLAFDFSGLDSWLSITPQFFMAICYAFTANYATFTLIQAFLFFLSSLLLIDTFVTKNKYLTTLLFIMMPMFYGFSIYHEMSTGCVIGLNFGILILFRLNDGLQKNWNKFFSFLYFFSLWLSFYIAFGFRQNAFTVFPVILFVIYYLYTKHQKKLFAIFQGICVSLSLFCVSAIPSCLGITVQDSSSAGFLWEILSTIQLMPSEKQLEYVDYLDFLTEEGSTAEALAVNDPNATIYSWRATIFPSPVIGDPENSHKILEKYVELFKNEPSYFLKNKLHFLDNNLGISEPIHNYEYDYNRADILEEYGLHNNALRRYAVDAYNLFLNKYTIFRMPYVWFLLGLLAIICSFKILPKENCKYPLLLFMISLFYYGAFLINTQSFEFRYFFPSFYYLFLLIIPTFFQLFSIPFKKMRKE